MADVDREYERIREQFHDSVLAQLTKLDRRVLDELQHILIDTANMYLEPLSKCESPIEKILLMWLIHFARVHYEESKYWDNIPVIHIEPQRVVERGKKKYRIDIALDCFFKGKQYRFAIECDGHDFHEKTKEQAARDKQRDRDLQAIGYQVIRFTGSEIWRRPSSCAYDVIKILDETAGFREEQSAYLRKLYPDDPWLNG